MPPRPRAMRSHQLRSPRRRVIWAQFETSVAFAANNTWSTHDLLGTFKATVGAQVTKVTVLRTHLWVCPTTASAVRDRWWIGLRVFDVDDINGAPAATATIPNPQDNPYVNWALATKITTDGAGFSIGGFSPGLGGTEGASFDLKSKRRLDNIQETWGLCIKQDTVGTVAKSYDVFARTLIALA